MHQQIFLLSWPDTNNHFLLICRSLFFLFVQFSITSDQSPTEFDTNTETLEKERAWVTRGRNSAVIVTAVWLTWVIFAQFIFPDSLPSSWFVRDANSYAATGW